MGLSASLRQDLNDPNKILMWDKMLSHTRMGVLYDYTHMGRPIRVWANIRIWGRTWLRETRPSVEWMGVAILTQHVVNACQRNTVLATKRTTRKTERFI